MVSSHSGEGARESALRGLATRREKARSSGRIDNSSLRAGAPMFYYCTMCGTNHYTCGESDFSPVPRHCDACAEDLKNGLLSASD